MFIHMYFEFLNKKEIVFNSSKDMYNLSTVNSRTIRLKTVDNRQHYLVSINLKLTPKLVDETGKVDEIKGVLTCLS